MGLMQRNAGIYNNTQTHFSTKVVTRYACNVLCMKHPSMSLCYYKMNLERESWPSEFCSKCKEETTNEQPVIISRETHFEKTCVTVMVSLHTGLMLL